MLRVMLQIPHFLQRGRIDLPTFWMPGRFALAATRVAQPHDLMFSHRHSWYAGSQVALILLPLEDRACSSGGQMRVAMERLTMTEHFGNVPAYSISSAISSTSSSGIAGSRGDPCAIWKAITRTGTSLPMTF